MTYLSVRTEHNTALITLKRPEALNALTMQMCHDIFDGLKRWADDDSIHQILIDADGDKAFCAGGDVAKLYHMGRDGQAQRINKFWREEYQMNSLIAHYPKPIIVLMQGYIMGGGVGIGGHASHRVVSESAKLAMPEAAIGLVPDVGGSHLLASAPGHIGEYMGVTGARIHADDIIFTGFADHIIAQEFWPDVRNAIINDNDLSILKKVARVARTDTELRAQLDDINRLFSSKDGFSFAQMLDQHRSEFADTVRKGMSRGSPLSMAAVFPLVRYARRAAHVNRALEYEYRFTSRAIEHADFLEGVRAVLVDKDHNPKWMYNTISEVSGDLLDSLYAAADFELTP